MEVFSPLRELTRMALRMLATSSNDYDVDRELAGLGVMKFRRGTEEERAQAIAAARERIANLKRQTFVPAIAGRAASAVEFEEGMIERLERGDVFTVPDLEKLS
jgi:hypothetical protein